MEKQNKDRVNAMLMQLGFPEGTTVSDILNMIPCEVIISAHGPVNVDGILFDKHGSKTFNLLDAIKWLIDNKKITF